MEANHKALKARLLERKSNRAAYACHGRAKAYNMPGTGWNAPADDGSRWAETLAGTGLRFVGYADELHPRGITHTGWYTDAFQEETFRGVVLQLPARDGKPQYLAAFEDQCNKGSYRVDLSRGIIVGDTGEEYSGYDYDSDAIREAARAADGFAESNAEGARNYSEAWQQGSQWAGLKEQEADARKEFLALRAEIKQVAKMHAKSKRKNPNLVCGALRDSCLELLHTIEKARKERAELVSNCWHFHAAAFNEGAGEPVISSKGLAL